MPAANKVVIQYPPGTGFLLALFPEGFQVIPMYVSATAIVFGFALLAIFFARSTASTLLATGFGCLAIYLMINPTKASYSVAPTMVVCALAGFFTARLLFSEQRRHRLALAALIALLLGLAVNFRLPNLFLASGYAIFLLVAFLRAPKAETFLEGALFAAAFLVGMVPTLLANAINAGSPFATTYGSADVTPPDLSLSVIWSYVVDMQFVLLLLAGLWTVLMWRRHRGSGTSQTVLLVAANLVVNLAFFLSHPVFTPYYTIPIAMLSLWTLLFAALIRQAEIVDDRPVGQAARA
jgi:hypothetical protein